VTRYEYEGISSFVRGVNPRQLLDAAVPGGQQQTRRAERAHRRPQPSSNQHDSVWRKNSWSWASWRKGRPTTTQPCLLVEQVLYRVVARAVCRRGAGQGLHLHKCHVHATGLTTLLVVALQSLSGIKKPHHYGYGIINNH